MRIGVDLGGTKIKAIALADDGRVRLRRRLPTPHNDYEATLRAVVDLVEGFERELGRRAAGGIGTPGAVSPATGLVKNYVSVPRLWSRWVFSDRVETRLRPPAQGDASGVRGAAWLWELGEAP